MSSWMRFSQSRYSAAMEDMCQQIPRALQQSALSTVAAVAAASAGASRGLGGGLSLPPVATHVQPSQSAAAPSRPASSSSSSGGGLRPSSHQGAGQGQAHPGAMTRQQQDEVVAALREHENCFRDCLAYAHRSLTAADAVLFADMAQRIHKLVRIS